MATPNFITQLATLLKDRRVKAGITQEELAKEVGMRRATVVDIENGKNVTLNNIALVADFLEIQLAPPAKVNTIMNTQPPRAPGRRINARLYPQLLNLLWDRKHDFDAHAKAPVMITEEEAYGLYEKQNRFIDITTMTPKEKTLFQKLKNTIGKGVYLGT